MVASKRVKRFAGKSIAKVLLRLPGRIGTRVRVWYAKFQIRDPNWSLVPRDQLRQIYIGALAQLADSEGGPGAYLEFGVFAGDSLACMVEAANAIGMDIPIVGFDSFQGLPAEVDSDPEDVGHWYHGQFLCPREVTEWNLTYRRLVQLDRLTLVEGWFDEMLTPELRRSLGIVKAGIVMVDCDAYASAKYVLPWVEPLIKDRAVLVFDDWYSFNQDESGHGEQRAFEEFLEAHPDLIGTELGTYLHPDGNWLAGKFFLVQRPHEA